MTSEAMENTDKEIWRAIPNDYYSPSIFVTKENNIGINVGGYVHVKSVEQWHKTANTVKIPTFEEIMKIWNEEDAKEGGINPIDFTYAILKKVNEK